MKRFITIWTSNLEIIRLLIEAGADVNGLSKEGQTALVEVFPIT